MENAASAINKLFNTSTSPAQAKADDKSANSSLSTNPNAEETVDVEVAPAVSHTHVKKQHETREQTNIEKEKHQDHYHTTIQPLKDAEVLPEKHDYKQETKHREVNNDDRKAKEQAAADRAGFKSTKEEKHFDAKTTEPTTVEEHVHHHLHETVQPVIEKGKHIHKLIMPFANIKQRLSTHPSPTRKLISRRGFKSLPKTTD